MRNHVCVGVVMATLSLALVVQATEPLKPEAKTPAAEAAPTNSSGLPPVVHEGVVKGPVSEVWHAFTSKDGMESWMAAHVEIDLRVGGLMRTRYEPEGVIGDAGTIENTILSFEPERMFSIKATKPPESFPFKQALQSMWTVVYFEPVTATSTKVRVVSMGFRDDDESRKMRGFFEAGNAWTLAKLQEKFDPAAAVPASAHGGDKNAQGK